MDASIVPSVRKVFLETLKVVAMIRNFRYFAIAFPDVFDGY
jgi:hypothetical protein